MAVKDNQQKNDNTSPTRSKEGFENHVEKLLAGLSREQVIAATAIVYFAAGNDSSLQLVDLLKAVSEADPFKRDVMERLVGTGYSMRLGSSYEGADKILRNKLIELLGVSEREGFVYAFQELFDKNQEVTIQDGQQIPTEGVEGKGYVDGAPNVQAEFTLTAANQEELFKALKPERKKLGLSQTDVAKAIGSSQSRVGRVERGEERCTIDWAQNYAKAIGINLALCAQLKK